MSQMKEHDKAPGKEVNEMQRSSQPDTEFKILVLRTLMNLGEERNRLRTSKKTKQKTTSQK